MGRGKKLLAELVLQPLGFILGILLAFWFLLGLVSGSWFGPWGFGG